MFSATSRYFGLPTSTFTRPDGTAIVYVQRRFVPQPSSLADLGGYLVRPADRIDLIAFRTLGDPELFWRIGDANGAMQPEQLAAQPGRKLRVTLPQGIPGGSVG